MQDPIQIGQMHPLVAEGRQRAAGRDNYFVTSRTPVFTNEQMAALRALIDAENAPAMLEGYGYDESNALETSQRRTKVRWLNPVEHRWVYEIIWREANLANQLLRFEVVPFYDTIQLARYDAEEQGFFRWHSDTIPSDMTRKLTVVVPLSDPADYEGGTLEFDENGAIRRPPQVPGAPVCFPSWLLHRVTPVTKGRRYSMAAWIRGPAWR
jgi:PKHD-type hydroxylase